MVIDSRRRVLSGAGLGALALAAAALALDRVGMTLWFRTIDRWKAAMTDPAPRLLPGGQVHGIRVLDELPTNTGRLIPHARRRVRVRKAVIHARSGDNHPVLITVRGYDQYTRRAERVTWHYGALPLAPGWRPVRSSTGRADRAERRVDGHLLRVTFAAALRGDRVEVTAGRLTVDGAPVPPAQAPAAVRAATEAVLVPRTFAVPLRGAGVTVTSVGVEDTAIGVELDAEQVGVGAGGERP